MKLLFSVVLGMMLLTCRGMAQEDNIMTATSALQEVLSTLQKGIEKLSLDNAQLVSQDNVIKQQVLQLQMQLGALEARGDDLNKAADKLKDKNPRLAQQISRLEEENSNLDDHIQKAEDGIKLIQRSLDAGYQVDQSPESQVAVRRQKERLRLMKMIYDSQQRQESLHESILEFQKNTTLLPAAAALAHQQLLKEQIKDLEDQIAAYSPEKSSASFGFDNQWDDAQLRQLESELKALEKNYEQLKDLMGKMSKKAQSASSTVSQHTEGEKLQNSMDDLNRQSAGLRADLDDLRTQMIQLDKRKSYLEMLIQQSPAQSF